MLTVADRRGHPRDAEPAGLHIGGLELGRRRSQVQDRLRRLFRSSSRSGDNETASGLTVGIGAEYKWTESLSLRGEYRFTNLDGFTDKKFFEFNDNDHVAKSVSMGPSSRFSSPSTGTLETWGCPSDPKSTGFLTLAAMLLPACQSPSPGGLARLRGCGPDGRRGAAAQVHAPVIKPNAEHATSETAWAILTGSKGWLAPARRGMMLAVAKTLESAV